MFFRAIVVTCVLAACAEKPSAPFVPQPPTLRRLTEAQVANTLRDRFGDDLVLGQAIEADISQEGSRSIGASHAAYSARGVEMSGVIAESVAAQILSDSRFLPCTPSATVDDTCARAFIETTGRYLWRRPLATPELDRLVTIASDGAIVLNDFRKGLGYAVIALLMSPDFLFRTELGDGSGELSPFDLASRLAFFVWASAPDDTLLDAAANGDLATDAGRAREVQRMLASPLARRGVRTFISDWLELHRLNDLVRDTDLFPSFAPDLGPSAREEVLRTSEHLVFDRNADLREWLWRTDTFVNRRLAALYGVTFPERGATHAEFASVTLPLDGPRAGLLGSAAFLLMTAHPTSTSTTLRGRFVSEQLVCRQVPDPPVDLNTGIPEPSGTAVTLRDRVTEHLQNTSCNSCHKLMDPQGLGFEGFDAIGRFRTTDNGAPIDASGEWNGKRFEDAKSLALLVAEDERLPACITKKLYRYAHGRVETADEKGEVEQLTRGFVKSGHRLLSLIETIALSPAFRRVAAVSEEVPQ